MFPFEATTQQLTVSVRPVYLDEQSDVFESRFVFAYFVQLQNHGQEEVQLLRRHWVIRHGDGRVVDVEGEGVIGQQPVLAPGTTHTYHSFCVLETMRGSMEGTYLMQRPNGARFRAVIPRFALRARAN
jgi:ApaG protein